MSRVNRTMGWGLVVLTGLVLAGTAFGQPPGKPGGRRPMGFGPGMMGGGPGGNWMTLLRVEKVQKELELVDDQKAKLREIGEKVMARMQEAFPRGERGQELSREERQARFAEMRKKLEAINQETRKAIEEVLLPHQVERLKQISLQIRGTQALDDPEVAKELGITDEQKQKIAQIREEAMNKGRELFGSGQPGEMREKFQALRRETDEKVLGVLTAEQKEKFEKMKGPKFEIDPQDLMGGFRGPGRPKGKQ